MTLIDSLIGKLEQATGPSMELAAEVLLACGWTRFNDPGPHYTAQWKRPDGMTFECGDPMANPLASLDSALTLVPDGARLLELGQWSDNGKPDGWFCQVARWIKTGEHSWTETGFAYGVPESGATMKPTLAPSPAIAVCIAALKARTSMESNHE